MVRPPVTTMAPRRDSTAVRTITPRQQFMRDTLAAHRALERCAKQAVLPDDEMTLDGIRKLLADARAAAQAGNLRRASGIGRAARQLAAALSCNR